MLEFLLCVCLAPVALVMCVRLLSMPTFWVLLVICVVTVAQIKINNDRGYTASLEKRRLELEAKQQAAADEVFVAAEVEKARLKREREIPNKASIQSAVDELLR